VKPAIREILQYVIDHPEMTTISAVDCYFRQFLFSLERQEWEKFTDQEKRDFVDRLDAAKGRPSKGPRCGDNKPTSK